MPLITCPDCLKQISDRVEACPFCGCPAKFFSASKESVIVPIPTSFIDVNKSDTEEIIDRKTVEPEEVISFSFGNSQVTYPIGTEKIAKLYGKYVYYAYEFSDKYFEEYASAGSMYSVLTDLADNVIMDIKLVVDEACKDLYSFGIKITRADFIKEYEIDFPSEINTLYNQYDSVQQEKQEISYKREVEKASRGRWQGGGFGMKGAIKGAMNAAVLNAGSGLLYSIGDGITKSSDKRYIDNKLIAIYNSKDNQNIFAQGVYCCFSYILEGIKDEMADADLIDIDIFSSYSEIKSTYETTIKYEKDREKLLAGMVQCFSCVPDRVQYYEPVINELFELDSDIESFLDFWGMYELYEFLEDKYAQNILADIENPFVRNIADVGIEIQEKPIECENGIAVVGRLVKGEVYAGEPIVLLNNGFCAGIITVISSIKEGNTECSWAKIGKRYEFILPIKQTSLLEEGLMLVDSSSFEKVEADLYARYYKGGNEIIWGFDDYCLSKGEHILFYFDENDKYTSCRGVDFSYDATRVMNVYGNVKEQIYDENNDVTLLCAKKYNWESALKALNSASFYLSYSFGDHYVLRYYFDDERNVLLAVYMKNVDTSKETDKRGVEQVTTKVQLQIECQKCGKVLKSNTKFCNFCGEPNPLYMKECPACGKQIKIDAKFCNFCGEQFA